MTGHTQSIHNKFFKENRKLDANQFLDFYIGFLRVFNLSIFKNS